jgi:arsenite methyltransferase
MAAHCPLDFDVDAMRRRVSDTYERVVHEPDGQFHFHRGIDFACETLRYDRNDLATLPVESTSRFAGVANPLRIGPIEAGEIVLDIGCGAGMDLLLAARRTGPTGHAIGVDMTRAMRERTQASAEMAGLGRIVVVREGIAEDLPVEDESVDVVISNGVLNLATDKIQAFGEIRRVLKPGGRLYLGDVVLQKELKPDEHADIDLWAG